MSASHLKYYSAYPALLLMLVIMTACGFKEDDSGSDDDSDNSDKQDDNGQVDEKDVCEGEVAFTDLNELSPTFEEERCFSQVEGKVIVLYFASFY